MYSMELFMHIKLQCQKLYYKLHCLHTHTHAPHKKKQKNIDYDLKWMTWFDMLQLFPTFHTNAHKAASHFKRANNKRIFYDALFKMTGIARFRGIHTENMGYAEHRPRAVYRAAWRVGMCDILFSAYRDISRYIAIYIAIFIEWLLKWKPWMSPITWQRSQVSKTYHFLVFSKEKKLMKMEMEVWTILPNETLPALSNRWFAQEWFPWNYIYQFHTKMGRSFT